MKGKVSFRKRKGGKVLEGERKRCKTREEKTIADGGRESGRKEPTEGAIGGVVKVEG